jgi:hypothetical protein
MKIKMLQDEIVVLAAGPVRWFAGEEYGPAEGLTEELAASLKGRGYAADAEVEEQEEELTPQQKAARTRAAKKAKKEAEAAAAEAKDEEAEE